MWNEYKRGLSILRKLRLEGFRRAGGGGPANAVNLPVDGRLKKTKNGLTQIEAVEKTETGFALNAG